MNGKQSYVIGACDAARIAEMKGRQGRKWEASTARADGPTVGGTRATAAGGTALTEPGEGGGGKADASSTRIQRTLSTRVLQNSFNMMNSVRAFISASV